MDENIEKMQNALYFAYNVSKFLIIYNYSKFKSYVLDYIGDFSTEYKKNVTNVILSEHTQTNEDTNKNEESNKKEN